MHLLHPLSALSLISIAIAHPTSDAEAPSANPSISRRGVTLSYYPWIAQYNVSDCSSGLISDKRVWPKVAGAGIVHDIKIDPRSYIDPQSAPTKQCVPWYPVVDQQNGPGVGVNFGTNNDSISQVQIFKETPECIAAYNEKTRALTPMECCDVSKGLLGVINANGTSEAFGAKKGLGSKAGTCVNIGKDGNQVFWQMRYLKATV